MENKEETYQITVTLNRKSITFKFCWPFLCFVSVYGCGVSSFSRNLSVLAPCLLNNPFLECHCPPTLIHPKVEFRWCCPGNRFSRTTSNFIFVQLPPEHRSWLEPFRQKLLASGVGNNNNLKRVCSHHLFPSNWSHMLRRLKRREALFGECPGWLIGATFEKFHKDFSWWITSKKYNGENKYLIHRSSNVTSNERTCRRSYISFVCLQSELCGVLPPVLGESVDLWDVLQRGASCSNRFGLHGGQAALLQRLHPVHQEKVTRPHRLS